MASSFRRILVAATMLTFVLIPLAFIGIAGLAKGLITIDDVKQFAEVLVVDSVRNLNMFINTTREAIGQCTCDHSFAFFLIAFSCTWFLLDSFVLLVTAFANGYENNGARRLQNNGARRLQN
ncbi:hypothetical protein K435DRAFT_853740 [Dendrothele bispora CBS 962.96]|uniref:Uncharacterized protein n=1 Tax=Dendrothele bispora (strain CBS 962.96) TaxID=1314807 RepID=A0A4S8MG75_DENBC|nr:hypothetical protein K435DRAFT_853740 [Dendrothele bispora CBS 962.96]